MRISDWSSDVCSSDLVVAGYLADDRGQAGRVPGNRSVGRQADEAVECVVGKSVASDADADLSDQQRADVEHRADRRAVALRLTIAIRSELREIGRAHV